MKLTKEEFRKLQQHWYDRLAEKGFRDIEKLSGDTMLLRETAAHCYCDAKDEFTRRSREEYFRYMGKMANDLDTEFSNEVERHILIRHADGATIKMVVQELCDQNISITRETVRFIIRRYQVAWEVKKYEPKKLRGMRSYRPKRKA